MKGTWSMRTVAIGTILFFGLAVQAVTIDLNSPGKPINRSLLGRPWYAYGAQITGTAFRGVVTELEADTFNWKLQTVGNANLVGAEDTALQFLRVIRDKKAEAVVTVNCRGTGPSSTNYGNFVWGDTTLPPLVTLAADYVRYINHTVQMYRQGDAVAGRDLSILNDIVWPAPADKLLRFGERETPKVIYWEIGNEPDGGIGVPAFALSGSEYLTRYKALTAAMLAEDTSIKVGPAGGPPVPGNANPMHAVFADPAARIDFVSYFSYDHLGAVWGNIPQMEAGLRNTKAYQSMVLNDWVKASIRAAGRSQAFVDSLEYISPEWNPQGPMSVAADQDRSMHNALAAAETIFAFADLGLRAAHFHYRTTDYRNPPTQYPTLMVFTALKDYMGDHLISQYSNGNNLRVYTTKNTATGTVSIWGLNFSNSNTASITLTLNNLELTNPTVFVQTLGNISGTTSLLDTNDPLVNPVIQWSAPQYVNSFNPANYTLIVPAASIRLLVIRERQTMPYTADTDTLGLWHFDEAMAIPGDNVEYTSADDSGNGNTVRIKNEASPSYNTFNVENRMFGASSLYVSNQRGSRWYARVPESPSLANDSSLTVEGWFYVTECANNTKPAYLIRKGSAASHEWSLAFPNNVTDPEDEAQRFLVGTISTTDSSNNDRNVGSAVSLTSIKNRWVHLAMTYDGNWLRVYLNGVQTGEKQFADAVPIYTATGTTTNYIHFLGSGEQGLDYSVYGYVDEVRVSNTVRSFDPIMKLLVSPVDQEVSWQAGTTSFNISNDGSGMMAWSAQVVEGADWLNITSSSSGTNTGNVTISYGNNPSNSQLRTGKIRVTAVGAYPEVFDVIVVQNVNGILNVSNINEPCVPDDKTLALWHFDEAMSVNGGTIYDSVDASGLSNTVKIFNEGTTIKNYFDTSVKRFGNSSLNINLQRGSRWYARVPESANFVNGGAITVEGWFYITGYQNSGYAGVLIRKGSTGCHEWSMWFPAGTDETQRFLTATISTSDLSSGDRYINTDISLASIKNQWVHLAMTYDGNWIRVFKNVQEIASKEHATTLPIYNTTGEYVHFLGSGEQNLNHSLFGCVDEVRVSNVVRLLVSRIAGDANLDGMVDVGDLGILAANYGQNLQGQNIPPAQWWGRGDFNNDGLVDVGDLGILAANYGYGTNGADFTADYTKVFNIQKEQEKVETETSSSVCSMMGLPVVFGILLMGLFTFRECSLGK